MAASLGDRRTGPEAARDPKSWLATVATPPSRPTPGNRPTPSLPSSPGAAPPGTAAVLASLGRGDDDEAGLESSS